MKKNIIYVLKAIYRMIPLSQKNKTKIKNILITKTKLFRRVENYNLQILNQSYGSNDITFNKTDFLEKLSKKIAVHLHLYYIDLAEEFITYLNNIPYFFDIYISVVKGTDTVQIREMFQKIKMVQKVVVEECQNQGRDFSPMLCQFGKRLLKYDYLLHLHSKKSFRTGMEQSGWRDHLVGSLLKDEKTVKRIFYQLEKNSNIGMIYPETYWDMPYWAHTYLKNFGNCRDLGNKLGISIQDEYIDYSVGSMFWVKVKALKPLFDLNLTYQDFGKEEGKADGTLAHAIERMIPLIVKKSNMEIEIIDNDRSCFRKSGLKNLHQYQKQTKENILQELLKYEIITFDIFDTLITRCIYSPSSIMSIIEGKLKKESIFNGDFKYIRFQAETNVRIKKNYQGDCSLDEIYDELAKITELTKNELELIKQMEIDMEISYAIPRLDMLEIFNNLKKAKKNIILISDMYLDSKTVTRMLNKCGYSGWNEMLISSETGLRKDNGEIWDKFYLEHQNTIHVGDNEASDIQMNCDLGKPFVHVMQGKKMYLLNDLSKYIDNNCTLTLGDSIALGLIVNKKIYNSPFNLKKSATISNLEEFGYCILGPIFYQFFEWLDSEIIKNKNDKLLFLAREGYYFQKMYQDYCKYKNKKPIKNEYFLTSRRSTSIANLQTEEDIDEILASNYEGSLANLLKNRFGLVDIIKEDRTIILDECREEVKQIILANKKELDELCSIERGAYQKYLNQKLKQSSKPAVIDLGYSGTIQYYLSKLSNRKIDGYYVTLTDNVKPRKLGCYCSGCFKSNNLDSNEKNIFLFSMILESFLTAPYGQLIKMKSENNKLNPIYKEEDLNKATFAKLDQIYDGITHMMKDLNQYLPPNLELSNEFIATNFSACVYDENLLSSEIKKFFVLENSYSLDGNINVMDYLRLVYLNKNN